MTTRPTEFVLRLADELRPAVPATDDRDAASEIANEVLVRARMLNEEIRKFAHQRFDAAPASATHAYEFRSLVSEAVLEWIRTWPK